MGKTRTIRPSLITAAVACCFGPITAWSNPVGPTVTHGQASFAQQGKQLTITNSPGSIINWQGFSIAAGETTRFVQQSAASAVLNRVVGRESSSILGALQSNGRVWLINPNGILFGAGALVDTAGLVASTLNVMNADFLMGRTRFIDTPGAKSVSNAGEIRTPAGGRVLLVSGQNVENSGIIQTPKGEVILAAGKTVEIADSVNPEIRVEVAAGETRAINLGKIVAESGKIGIYGGLVANRGQVSADSAVVGENGKIVFRASRDASLEAGSVTTASGAQGGSIEVEAGAKALVAGTVAATGSAERGGQISVLGEQVGLIENARLDVSGERGGGTVLVGGDYQGANPAVRNAQMTYVGAGTSISADAVGAGNGGKVIVWADDTTRSHGAISARGGARGGDGGFVETSGKLGLDVTRGPDVRAPAGNAGTWLIDPNNISIVAGAAFDATTNTGAPFFAPLTDASVIGVDLINAQLDFGSSVIINTTSRGPTTGTDPGNITLSAPILKRALTLPGGPVIGITSLTLQAHNDIVITPTGSIASTGDRLNVILTANSDGVGGGGVTLGGPITTNGGTVTIQGRDLVAIVAPIVTLNPTGVGGGTVSISSSANAAAISAPIVSGSSVVTSGQAGVTIAAPISGSFYQASSTAGPVVIASNVTTTGGVTLGGSGVTVASGAVVNAGFGNFTATDIAPTSLNIQAGASITSSGATLTSDNMEILGTINAGAGSVTLRQNTALRPMFFGANDASGVALASGELANVVTTGSLFLGNLNTGALTFNAPVNFAGVSQVAVQSSSTITQKAGATITSAAPMTFTAPTGITLHSTSSAPRFTFTSNSFAPNQPVVSASDIDVRTSTSGTAINLGVAAPGVGALDLTREQLNNLNTAPTGVLRIGTTSSGALTIQGAIAPAGTQTLRLASNSSISQVAGATITATNLALQVSNGPVDLPEANVVGTLAASVCCAGDSFKFHNAAGTPLTIGSVDFIDGVSNFASDATTTAYIDADQLNIASPLSFPNGSIYIKPITSTVRTDLGGADAAGVLGLTAAELALINAGTLLVCTNEIDITTPIAPGVNMLSIQPLTAGRSVHIVAGPKNPANLEFVQADIGNVTVGTLLLGGAGTTTGPLTVFSALTVPATIGAFGLHTGDTVTGLTVNAAISATNNVSLLGDLMTLNALTSTSGGSLTVANSGTGRIIDLGTRTTGKLALSTAEIQTQLSAPAGTLAFGSSTAGDLNTRAALNITNAANVALISGGTATVDFSTGVAANGGLSINAPRITLNGTVSSTTGDVTLAGNRMDIAATVSAPAGNINARPQTFRPITVGTDDTVSTLGLTLTELNFFSTPGAVRIGDTVNTGNISVTAALGTPMPLPFSTLSLVTNGGSISQTPGSTITVSNLAAQASGSISLDQNNDTNTFAARTNSSFSNINYTEVGTSTLTIDTVDGLSGVQTFGFGSNVTLRADTMNINQRVEANFGSGNVTLVPLTVNRPGDIGSKPDDVLGLTEAEFNRIRAGTLFFGSASTGNVTVSVPVNMTGGVNNLNIQTAPTATTAVSSALTVPGSISVNTGTLNTSAAVTSTFGAFNAIADAMTFGSTVTSGGNSINLHQQTAGTLIAVGGIDAAGSPAATLGLGGGDLMNLSYGTGSLVIGNSASGDMSVTVAGTLPGSVSLATGGNVSFMSNFSAGDNLNISANGMSIPGVAGISAPNGINIATTTAGRKMTLGTRPGVAGDFELDATEIAKISIGGPGTLTFDTSGLLKTTAPLALTLVPNVALIGGTIDHSGGTLSAPGDITFRGDSMLATGFSGITSTGGGRVTLASRSVRSLNLGTNPAGAALGLLASQIGAISTSGVVQLGDQDFTSSVTVTAPITQPAGSSALTIASSGAISQSAGATISASNLNLQTLSSVNLSEANVVGTLAGSSAGSFSFTGAGTLTIGTVDGMTGISDSTITLRSDGLAFLNPVNGGTTTLAPRVAGTPINLGGGGGYAITDAMVDLVSGFTLNIGNNTSGPITVTSAVDRAAGILNLVTVPGSSIVVAAPLGSATTNAIGMNTGLGGTVSIGGAVQASGDISAIGRTIAVNAPITTEFGSVTLGAAATDTGSNIVVNSQITALNNIRLTADAQSINAPPSINAPLVTSGSTVILEPRTAVPVSVGGETPGALSINPAELALISTDGLTIGSTSGGTLTVVGPIGPFNYDSLSLQSSKDVTQLPGATITVRKTDPVTGAVTGALNVVAGERIILPEANDVAVSVSGTAGGTGNNFEFNNITPLKLQNVSGVFASGKVLLVAPPGTLVFVPPDPGSGSGSGSGSGGAVNVVLLEDLVSALLTAQETQEKADKEADERKEESAKQEQEQQKKEGTKSC